jgi:hypothetical protein
VRGVRKLSFAAAISIACSGRSASPALRCPDDSVLVAMAERSVDAQQFAALEAHIDECHECRQVLGAAVADHA